MQTLEKSELAPTPTQPASALHAAAADLLRDHGASLAEGAERAGVTPPAAAAILLAEGQFAAPAVDERMPVRFEPYAFFQATGRWLIATHKDQAAEYRAFAEARAVDPEAALACTRMGLGQVSGLEAQQAGFTDADAMMQQLQGNPAAQVQSLIDLVQATPALQTALHEENWRDVALLRAGPGYAAIGYDDVLAASAQAYKEVSSPIGVGGGDDGDAGSDKPKRRRKS